MRNLVGATIPPQLAAEALRIVEDIRGGRLTPKDSERVVKVIVKMSETVMHFFFMRPTEAFGVGMTLRGIVQFGVSSALKGISYGLGKIVPKLNQQQLLQLADFLDEALYDAGAARK